MILSWIPIFGPVIEGVFGWLNKREDTAVTKIKTDGDVRKIETVESTKVLSTFKDDIGLRFSRDILVFPWALYGGVTGWDYLVVNSWPHLVVSTKAIPETSGLAYLPYMVFVFLLGNIGLNMWNQRR